MHGWEISCRGTEISVNIKVSVTLCKQEVLMEGRKEIDNKPPYLGHNPQLLMVLRRHPSYHIHGKCHPKKLLRKMCSFVKTTKQPNAELHCKVPYFIRIHE